VAARHGAARSGATRIVASAAKWNGKFVDVVQTKRIENNVLSNQNDSRGRLMSYSPE
jgi:hypothetical protein